MNLDYYKSGIYTPKTVDVPHDSLFNRRNRSISRVSISTTSSKYFKPKISSSITLLSLKGIGKGSVGGGKKFSPNSNYLLPRTTTVIEKENSTDGSDQDAKSDI